MSSPSTSPAGAGRPPPTPSSSSVPPLVSEPDATYRSLLSLLLAGSASSRHLLLLPEPTLTASIAHYLSSLPSDALPGFVRALCESACLWACRNTTGGGDTAQDATTQVQGPQLPTLDERSMLVYNAAVQAVLRRHSALLHSRAGSLSYGTERQLSSWVRKVMQALSIPLDLANTSSNLPKISQPVVEGEADPASKISALSLPALSITSGLLTALYSIRQQLKERKTGLNPKGSMREAAKYWGPLLDAALQKYSGDLQQRKGTIGSGAVSSAWEKEFERHAAGQAEVADSAVALSSPPLPSCSSPLDVEAQAVCCVLSALGPNLSETAIELRDSIALINLCTPFVQSVFDAQLLTSVNKDVVSGPDGLEIKADSELARRIRSSATSHNLPRLGPITRIAGLALGEAARSQTPEVLEEAVHGLEEGLHELSRRWEAGFVSADLSTVAPASEGLTTQLWTLFKSLLFGSVMLYDGLLDGLLEAIPSQPLVVILSPESPGYVEGLTSSNIPPVYLALCHSALQTLSNLSFVSHPMGDSFEALRRTTYAALDILARDARASVSLITDLRRSLAGGEIESSHKSWRREKVTFFLDACEQLVPSVPDAVHRVVLDVAKYYLEDNTWPDTFESAHSVVLALLSAHAPCSSSLAPYYSSSLLKLFPEKINAEQLEHAYCTLVDSASSMDDALALWCAEQLRDEIESERSVLLAAPPQSAEPSLKSDPRSGSQIPATRLETLQAVHVALLPSLHLVLLQTHLSFVKRHLLSLPADSTQREALAEKTFDALAGLDAATREEGLAWWAREREAFGV
ncbi:hypothetical protein CBOM_02062 [Ceraceosorus bombacis]|uniref:Uncharacterized protein n=1 Tax=Ceraceosorus bombacis TaxID=401625 RepID=A0A0P1BDY3_9BASI|nr:hypothetical protein CBOM_02062 [Ceraceosorus bombacis]